MTVSREDSLNSKFHCHGLIQERREKSVNGVWPGFCICGLPSGKCAGYLEPIYLERFREPHLATKLAVRDQCKAHFFDAAKMVMKHSITENNTTIPIPVFALNVHQVGATNCVQSLRNNASETPRCVQI